MALGSLLASQSRANRRRERRERKADRRDMLLAFGLQAFGKPVAESIGKLINAPYRESINRFVNDPANATARAGITAFSNAVANYDDLVKRKEKSGLSWEDFNYDEALRHTREKHLKDTGLLGQEGDAGDKEWNQFFGSSPKLQAQVQAIADRARKQQLKFEGYRQNWNFKDLDNVPAEMRKMLEHYSHNPSNILEAMWKPVGRFLTGKSKEDQRNETINSALLHFNFRDKFRNMFVGFANGDEQSTKDFNTLMADFKEANQGITASTVYDQLDTFIDDPKNKDFKNKITSYTSYNKAAIDEAIALNNWKTNMANPRFYSDPIQNQYRKSIIAKAIEMNDDVDKAIDITPSMYTKAQSTRYGVSKLDANKLKTITGYIKNNPDARDYLFALRDSVALSMGDKTYADYDVDDKNELAVQKAIREESDKRLEELIRTAHTEHAVELSQLLDSSNKTEVQEMFLDVFGSTDEQAAAQNDTLITLRVIDMFHSGRYQKEADSVERVLEERPWYRSDITDQFYPYKGILSARNKDDFFMNRFLPGHEDAVRITQQQADTTTDQPSVDTDQPSVDTDQPSDTTTTDIEKIKAVAQKNNEPYAKVVEMVQKVNPNAIRNSVLTPAMSIFSEKGQTTTAGKRFRITNEGDKFNVTAYTKLENPDLFGDRAVTLLASEKYIPNFNDIPEGPIKNDMRLIADELFSIVDKYDNPETVFGGPKTLTGRGRRASAAEKLEGRYGVVLGEDINKDLENDRVMVSRILDVIDLPGLGDLNEVRSFLTQVREDTLSQNKETTVPSILANPVDMDSITSLIKLEEAVLTKTSADSFSKVGGKYVRNPGGKNVPLTGGYGHLLTAAERKQYPEGTPIPQWQIDKWFKEDLKKAYDAAVAQNKQLSKPIDIARLTSVNFQLGTGWHKDHDETWKALVAGDYDLAAEEIKERSKWYTQTPSRADAFIDAILSLKP
tara:strand:+ start:2947 stop:5814 length:2868 start_codon:yes stop_codon:yes gene_type:complete